MDEKLKVIITAEVNKLKEGIQNAKKQIDDFGSKVDKNSNAVKESFKKMGDGISKALKVIGTGIVALGAALIGISATTQEYRDDIAKLNAAFESANLSTNSAKVAYQDLYRVLGETDQAVEASQQIALLADSEEEVARWSAQAAGVVGTFGDALQPETFFEAANETLKLGEATGAYVQMLEGTGQSVEEFNKGLAACATEQEKQAYMLEFTEKSLGTAGEAYKKANADVLAQRDAQMSLTSALASVGAAVAPVITAFTAFAGQALAAAAPYLESFISNYLPTLQALLTGTAEVLGVVMGFVVDNIGVLATVAGIITGIAAAITLYNTVQAISEAIQAAKIALNLSETASLWSLVAAQTAALAPYMLIVAAIAAVIAIVVVCIKHWDEIKAKVIEVATAIKEKIQEMADKVVSFFQRMKDGITQAWENAKQAVKNGIDKIVSFFQSIFDWISGNWQGLLLLIVNPFMGAFKLAYDNCEQFRNKVNEIFNKIKDAIKNALEAAKNVVSNIFSAIGDSIKTKINKAKDTVQNVINKIKSIFNFQWKLPHLKLPRISISGSFSLTPPSVPKFSLSWNKLGGVFDTPTIFPWGNTLQGLAEDGAEAIVPLEKNTYWIDRLAQMITGKMGGTNIVLQVDGKTFAQTSIDSINALTRQQGKLGLTLL